MMYQESYATNGTGIKAVVIFLSLLLMLVFAMGGIFAGTYWGNPLRAKAEAERLGIENRVREGELAFLDQRQALDLQAHAARLGREQHWYEVRQEFSMSLALLIVACASLLIALCVGVPRLASAREKVLVARAALLHQQIELMHAQQSYGLKPATSTIVVQPPIRNGQAPIWRVGVAQSSVDSEPVHHDPTI